MENQLTQEAQELKQESELVVSDAKRIAANVCDDKGLSEAAEFLKKIKGMRNKISEKFSPLTKSAYATWKNILSLEKELDDPLAQAENSILKPAMGRYQQEQERARQKAQDEIRARMKAEEEDARLAQAVIEEKQGNVEIADAIISAPVYVPPVILPTPVKTEGVSYRENWKFEIVNQSEVPMEYLLVNEAAIGKVVRALKDKTNIKGIRVYSEKSVAVKG